MGFIPSDIHLFGLVDENGTVDTVTMINIMGADSMGRDIYSRLLYGSQVSLTIPFVSAAISFVLGILLGEQIIPVGKQLLQGHSFEAACSDCQANTHVLGELPGRKTGAQPPKV